jgi:hypothetical protein
MKYLDLISVRLGVERKQRNELCWAKGKKKKSFAEDVVTQASITSDFYNLKIFLLMHDLDI